MIKRKIIPKFGIIFKDANIEVAGSTNLKAWDKDEQAKLKTIKPIVYIVFKNLEGYKILKFGDLIIQINKKKINNIYELLIERKKLKWNSTINFKIIRIGFLKGDKFRFFPVLFPITKSYPLLYSSII